MRTGSPPTSSVHPPGLQIQQGCAGRWRDPVANPSLTEIAGIAVLSMGLQVADQRHTLACRPRAISILRHEAQGSATGHTCDGTHATAPVGPATTRHCRGRTNSVEVIDDLPGCNIRDKATRAWHVWTM
jgi:hypothetical protein